MATQRRPRSKIESKSRTFTLTKSRRVTDETSESIFFVLAPHPHRTNTKVPVRLCIHSFCSQWQIPTEVYWLSVLPRTRTRFGESGFFYSGPAAWNSLPSNLHHITDTSTFRTTQERIFWSMQLITDVGAPGRVVYSGALQISRWLIDDLIIDKTQSPEYFYVATPRSKRLELEI